MTYPNLAFPNACNRPTVSLDQIRFCFGRRCYLPRMPGPLSNASNARVATSERRRKAYATPRMWEAYSVFELLRILRRKAGPIG